MNSVWIEIFIIFLSYWTVLIVFKRRLESKNVSIFGPILLVRTRRGLRFLDLLAKYKKFWRTFGNLGILLVLVGMIYMVILVLIMDYVMVVSPPKPSPVTSPRNVLLIPGLNEFIPFIWGLIGLIVTLIVHEFSHAILSRVEDVRVKSLGVVFALIPIGGFAEPDEKELLGKGRKSRMMIYSAGITANFLIALLSFSIFFSLLGFLKPHVIVLKSFNGVFYEGDAILKLNGFDVEDARDVLNAVDDRVEVVVRRGNGEIVSFEIYKPEMGVYILNILNGTPAESVGMRGNSVIVSINEFETPNTEVFRDVMMRTKPNEVVRLKVLEGGEIKTYEVKLSEKDGHGFLGVLIGGDYFDGAVIGYSKNIIESLTNIPRGFHGLFYLTAMPFYFRSFDGITNYFTPRGIFEGLGETIFYLLNTFYWIAWLNFYIGLFNCLPAIPLDGGRYLNDLLGYFMNERFASAITKSLAFFVFLSIFMSILIPNMNL